MYIESIRLKNFRSFSSAELRLSPGFNLITGSNAQGKTNIIESLGLIGTGKSFRTPEFRDMIRWGEERSEIFARTCVNSGGDDLSIIMDLERKTFFKNSKKVNPAGMSKAAAVIFAPEEILLLKDSPSGRRHYMDRIMTYVEPAHYELTKRYERIVSQRNKILQGEETDAEKRRSLEEWNFQLEGLGAKVIMARERICREMNYKLPAKYQSVAPKDGAAEFVYRPHCGYEFISGGEEAVKERLRRQIEERAEDEFLRGVTLAGPHRDDFEANVGASPLKHFGSQGQHRTFVLALKLTEMEIFENASGETPILLLDDVASELDAERCALFFKHLGSEKYQVLVTATEENQVLFGEWARIKHFKVKEGTVCHSDR